MKEYFPQIGKIPFEGTESMNPMAFHYYDAERVVMGKKMKDWLKFAMLGGTHLVRHQATSLVVKLATMNGTKQKMLCSVLKTRPMQVSRLWRNWASTISASMM